VDCFFIFLLPIHHGFTSCGPARVNLDHLLLLRGCADTATGLCRQVPGVAGSWHYRINWCKPSARATIARNASSTGGGPALTLQTIACFSERAYLKVDLQFVYPLCFPVAFRLFCGRETSEDLIAPSFVLFFAERVNSNWGFSSTMMDLKRGISKT
jgi:hypothetical protein